MGTTKKISKALRKAVFARDGQACMYCLALDRALTLDHVVARADNGPTSLDNLVVACESCNGAKGDLSLADFITILRMSGVDTRGIAERIAKALVS